MPFPHRELTYARGMYMRGEQLTVQTPEFEDFANNIANITSRNELIWKTKRMCIERGFRSKLSMATTSETKSIHIIFLCGRSDKSSLRCKNPSVKGLCPFLLHYERRSQIGVNKSFRHAAEQYPAKNAESLDVKKRFKSIGKAYDDLFKSHPPTEVLKSASNQSRQSEEPDIVPAPKTEINAQNDLLEDIDIAGDPYYLKYYRSFHNHELDPHLTLAGDSQCQTMQQSLMAIQYLQHEERKQSSCFDSKHSDVTKLVGLAKDITPVVVEPKGCQPFVCQLLDSDK